MVVYCGSTALVTRASKELGEVFANALAARDMNPVLIARSVEALRALAERPCVNFGVQCVLLNAEVADPKRRQPNRRGTKASRRSGSDQLL
jgi:short-subunit dehydrogenase